MAPIHIFEMRHIISAILFIVIAAPTTNAKGDDSLSNYYSKKYKAELAIVDSNYQEALLLYNAAFSYKRPHERDLYNAFILSCLMQDSLHGKKYFDQLTFLGLTEESLTADLRQGKIDTKFIQKINSDYQRIHNKSLQASFKRHAKVMDSMYNFDQGIRQYAMNTYGHVEGLKRYNDSFVVVDSLNIARMLTFIEKQGFPEIYSTGFYATNYIHISSYPMISLLLKHSWGIPSSRSDKAKILWRVKTAVLEGKYDPRDYAFFMMLVRVPTNLVAFYPCLQ
jgi:hypothetical protein